MMEERKEQNKKTTTNPKVAGGGGLCYAKITLPLKKNLLQTSTKNRYFGKDKTPKDSS